MKWFGILIAVGLSCPGWGSAQNLTPDNPLFRVDPNKEIQLKEFNAAGRDPKMARYDQTRQPKAEQHFNQLLPVKQADGLLPRSPADGLAARRWSGGTDREPRAASSWESREAKWDRRAPADGKVADGPRAASGLSTRVQEPKIYQGPENPAARPESEVIRNTLGSVQSVEQLGEHRLSQAEIRRLLMTPERVRRAEAADRDPGITVDVAPRAVPVQNQR